jgi:hypothetical protein
MVNSTDLWSKINLCTKSLILRKIYGKRVRAHNNCVRLIAGVRRREHISGFREQLGYVRLDLRRRMLYFGFIFKLFLTIVFSIYFLSECALLSNSWLSYTLDSYACVGSHDLVVYCHCLWALERRWSTNFYSKCGHLTISFGAVSLVIHCIGSWIRVYLLFLLIYFFFLFHFLFLFIIILLRFWY